MNGLISPEEILLHILNMILLFLMLRQLLYKPVRKFMHARAERLQGSLAEAAEAHAQVEELKQEYERRIAAAEDTARERALEITAAANASAKSMAESAREESAALLNKARLDARREHDQALEGLHGEVADLALGIAEQVLGREVRREDSLRLADEFFAGTQEGGETI